MRYTRFIVLGFVTAAWMVIGCDGYDLAAPGDRAVTDVDGNVYDVIQIGEQRWLAENLRTTRYRNGDGIPTALSDTEWSTTTSGAYAVYPLEMVDGMGPDEDVVEAYGILYNWYAAADPRGLCPAGWRLPGDGDLKQLEMHLGMTEEEADRSGLRGTDEGGKLKATRTEPAPHPRWNSPNSAATDESGWSGLPAGAHLFHGGFYFVGLAGYWWSTTEYDTQHAWSHELYTGETRVGRHAQSKRNGFSVRCLSD